MTHFVQLLATFNAGDIAFIKSVLDGHDIRHRVEGENFLQVHPLAAPVRIMVDSQQLEEAKEILKDFKSGSFGFELDKES